MTIRTKLLATVAALATSMIGLLCTPAAAQPPAQSGVVERFTDPGFAFVVDEATLDGEQLLLVALFNFETVEALCAMAPSRAADIQLVSTPSGQQQVQVKDTGVPVLLFDITDDPPVSPEAFLFRVCTQDALDPFASGTARIHQQVTESSSNETFRVMFHAQGRVSDGTTTWRLVASFHEAGTFADGVTSLRERIVIN